MNIFIKILTILILLTGSVHSQTEIKIGSKKFSSKDNLSVNLRFLRENSVGDLSEDE